MTMVSELVLTRNQLLEIARRQDDGGYKVPLQRLSHVTAELQEGVMKTRMQPIGTAWQKLPRVVRDLSAELAKKIELVMQGAETELDRQVLELIKDPLTHMVRNSADHGIESPLERRAAGKPEKGTIRLAAYHEGGTITIEIADDGRGLDFASIRGKVRERGLAAEPELDRMSDAQVAKFIFHPGFSTAKAVTAVSGRGVGMDVVKTNIELIGGTVDIASERGRGTSFTIKIPLTLAIVAALIVSAGEERFAIPQVAVLELVRVRPGSEHVIERINGTPVLRLRERLLPVVPIATVLDLPGSQGSAGEEGFVVVTQVGREFFGILVDGVFHTEEIVVKPMSSKLRHIPLFSGNTILGDGAVVLIIDPNGIARVVGSAAGREQFATAAPLAEAAGDAAEAVTLLIFRGGGESLKAVPLSLVTRLEKIDAGRIEWVGGRPLIQYRGRLMPLVPADPEIAIRREGTQALVVFSDGERSMGLVVDEIVDIVDDRLEIELVADRSDVVGSAVIRNRATEIVNVAHYLPLAHDDWARPARGRGSAGSPTVLLVDDSAFFRELLTPVLKAAGYRVAAAESAERAMALIASGARVDARRDRHRHAGDERLRPRRGAAPGPALGSPAGDRAGVGADAAGGRAGAPARHRRVRGEVRPQRPRRRACRDARPDRRSRMTAATESSAPGDAADLQASEYVTVTVADQMFGLAIDRVHDVFIASALTTVPLAPPEIVGLLNLRGRVVTAMCLRRRLGLPDREGGRREMAVGLEHHGESYGLLVDEIGEVMKLSPSSHEPNPVHLDERWIGLSRGVHRLEHGLLIILDIDAVLAFGAEARAA